jgi:hypothetical protein
MQAQRGLMPQDLIPIGECWCGYGGGTGRGSFVLPGHNKVAHFAVLLIEYGGVPEFLAKYGYEPEGKNPRKAFEAWRNRNKTPRSEVKQEPNTTLLMDDQWMWAI